MLTTPIEFCTISGIVYEDTDGDCEIDTGEPPLEGYEVCIFGEYPFFLGGIPFSATTDANGFYSIEVPCGDYYFSCDPNPNPCPLCPLINEFLEQNTTIDLTVDCGNPNPGAIQGDVFIDANLNCANDGEVPLQDWTVAATVPGSGDTTFLLTDINGHYFSELPSGFYEVHILDPTSLWQACASPQTVNVTSGPETVDFAMQEVETCYYLTVDVGAFNLISCTNSIWQVHFCNQGTSVAEDAFVMVTLDPQLTYVSSSLGFSSSSGNTYTFQLGDLQPGQCGLFTITAFVDCEAELGEALCTDAHIFPDDNCDPVSPVWDESNIEVTVECDEASEQVIFTISNNGPGDMSGPQPFVVIEDNVLLLEYLDTTFILDAGGAITVILPANGSTYIVHANQHPNHPYSTFAAAWAEGCGEDENGNFSVGYVMQYAFGDDEPYLDIECQEVVGAYDPNIKLGIPRGITEQHYVQPTTELEYQIIFQNTGNAPAAKVVVRDTLPTELDASTLRPLVASHPYSFSMQGGNVAVFTFNNINLPPESANPAGSIGYVKFEISQKSVNQPGTVIENSAAIYFDNNPPILTPPYVHRIPMPEMTQTETVTLCPNEPYDGWVYNSDTTLVDTVHFQFFDSIFITEIIALPEAIGYLHPVICADTVYIGPINCDVFDPINPCGIVVMPGGSYTGCDSLIDICVNFLPLSEFFLENTLCPGESLTVNGKVYDEANPFGEEIFDGANTHGCDSTVHVLLSFWPAANDTLALTLCPGESLAVNGTVYDEANPEGTEVLANASWHGCDSTVHVSLSFWPAANGQIAPTLCSGESLIVNGTVYDVDNPEGIEILANASQHGCDSTVQIDLTFHPLALIDLAEALCPGESMIVNGTTYDEANPTGTEVLSGESWLGCDSTIKITLEFFDAAASQITETLCPSQSLTVNGTTYDELNPSGIEILANASWHGCDSTIEVTLSFWTAANGQIAQTLCPGESLTVNGTTYDETNPEGTEILANASWHGCDSTIEVSLSFWPAANGQIAQTLCPGGSLTVNGTTYDEANPSGIEILANASQHGCDSTVEVSLSFHEIAASQIIQTLCLGGSLTVNGTVYDEANPSGIEVFESANGCDSTVTISLTFDDEVLGQLNPTLCPGEGLTVNGTVYDESNPTGSETFPNGSYLGCDSTVQVSLIFHSLAESDLQPEICPGESVTVNGTVYDADHPSGVEVLPNAAASGCDSTIYVDLEILENSFTQLDTTFAEGEMWNDFPIFSDTVFTEILPAANGCDSLVEVTISVETTAVGEGQAGHFGLRIFPNPTGEGEVTLEVHLPQAAPISLYLSDGMGRRVRTFFENKKMAEGKISHRLDLVGLPPGVYHLLLAHPSGRRAVKLVRL